MSSYGGGGGVDGIGGSSGVDDRCGNIVDKGGGGGLHSSGLYFGVGWGFCGEGGGKNAAGGGVCCEASLLVWEREGRFFVMFSLMLVEMNELSVDACLFGTVIWADCFGQIVDSDVVVQVVVVEAVDVVPARFVFFRHGCLGNMMGARVMIEVVVRVVLVWWRWSVCGSWWCRQQRSGCGEL